MKAPKRQNDDPSRAWVGVVARAHVLRGVAGGFAQLCHGKHGQLARMNVGDWLVYYSPKTDFPDGAPLRAFTALGRVIGENVYAFDMGGGFVPYRRDIAYLKEAREVPIREVASDLEFMTRRSNWGMLARRGHFEIKMSDLHRIGIAMGVDLSRASECPCDQRRAAEEEHRTDDPHDLRRRHTHVHPIPGPDARPCDRKKQPDREPQVAAGEESRDGECSDAQPHVEGRPSARSSRVAP